MSETTHARYRAPTAVLEAAPEPRARYEASGGFSILRCLQDGWDSMQRNRGPFVGVGILTIAGFTAYFVGMAVVAIASQGSMLPIYVALAVVYLGLGPLAMWGTIRFSLNAIDGRARFADLFSIFQRLGSRFASSVAVWLFLMIASLPGSAPLLLLQSRGSTDLGLQLLAQLLSIAWAVLLSTRFFFSYYFLIDREMGAREALRASWDWTRGNALRLLGLFALSAGVILAGTLLLLVGVIPAMLLAWQMYSAAFRQLAGSPREASAR